MYSKLLAFGIGVMGFAAFVLICKGEILLTFAALIMGVVFYQELDQQD